MFRALNRISPLAMLMLIAAQPVIANAECGMAARHGDEAAVAAPHDHSGHESRDSAPNPAHGGEHERECTMTAPCTGWSVAPDLVDAGERTTDHDASIATTVAGLVSAVASVDTPPPRA